MKQRIVIWGAVAALAVGAAGLVVVASGGDGDEEGAGGATPPRLPLDPSSLGAGSAAPANDQEASAMALAGPITYVAGPELPDLGGEGAAYEAARVDAERFAALAGALGVDGEPVEDGGSWHVTGALSVDAYGPGGSWSAMPAAPAPDAPQSPPPADPTSGPTSGTGDAPSDTPAGSGGGSGGVDPAPAPPSTVVCITAPCDPPLSDPPELAVEQPEPKLPAEPATVPPCPADPGGGSCAVPACEPGPAVDCAPVADETPPATADPALEAEARDLAARLLEATGFDPAAAKVSTVPGPGTVSVSFEPTLDGTPAPGLAGSVVVGAGGVQSASGYFAPGEPLGTYPLITTRDAIERLNEPGDVSILVSPVPGAEPGVTVTGAPPTPAPATEVVLTSAEVVYLSVPSWDDSGTYVVPGYRLAADDGTGTSAAALALEALRPPPSGGD